MEHTAHEPRVSFQIDECMKEPELPPSPLLNELSFQVLSKIGKAKDKGNSSLERSGNTR